MKFDSDTSFFDAQPMFVCEQATLRILDVNEAATKVLGFNKKKFLKKRVVDFGEEKSIEDLQIHLEETTKKTIDKVWVFETADKESIYVQLSAHLINYKGRPAKLVIAHNLSDIVGGKKSPDKLLSSQLSLNNFPLAEIEWDSNLNITRWSPKAVELFGYTEEEAISESRLLEKFIHKDDVERVKEIIRDTYKKRNKDVSVINRNITKDGRVIYCEWYNSLLYDKDDDVVAMYSLVHDVTDREEALNDTKRSMMSYQDLFNSISDAIYLLNKDGIIIEANDGLESTFGYKREEVVGKHTEVLAPPGKYDAERIEDIIKKAFEGITGKYEGWGRKKNGEIIPTEFLVNTGNYFGDQVIIVIERDISDRKQSEEALKQREGLFSKLFNSSPIGIALLNEHHEVEMVNDGFEQLFGYRENELKGLELDKLIVPAKRHEFAISLTESSKVQEVTEKRVRKDGTILDVIIYAVPVVVDKSVVGIYGIYVDITDRRRAEESIRQSLKEKEMLLAEVHHRVKNNLAVITGLLELQSYSADNDHAKQILKESQMRVNSIAMVHEKLYQTEDFSEIDINQYFEELTAVIHKTMKSSKTKVEIKLEIASIKLPIIQAIPCGLLLNEIITNSYKHAFEDREKGVISVSLTKESPKIYFRIKDDGIGLPKQLKTSIHSSLGMTLIKTLAKQLNSSFDFRSEEGAVFEFEFSEINELEID